MRTNSRTRTCYLLITLTAVFACTLSPGCASTSVRTKAVCTGYSSSDKVVINTSFNELAEHTHIEPTREFGWFYIDRTAKFVDEFKRTK